MAKAETYDADGYRCTNCGWAGSVPVIRGHLKPDVAECPRCGCKTATVAIQPVTILPMPYPVPYVPYARPSYPHWQWWEPSYETPQVTWCHNGTITCKSTE